MFTAALFITAKTWKQTECPLAQEWIKNVWYIYAMEYYSVMKKINTHTMEYYSVIKKIQFSSVQLLSRV